MAIIITWPSNTREVINAIRGTIGRLVTFYTIAGTTGCSSCTLDPVNNTSTNPFCPECGGDYWTVIYSGTEISGHVRWFPFHEQDFTSVGINYEGDCVVTIEHTSGNMNIVQNTEYVEVDGTRILIDRYVLRGKPDVNRIRLLLKEEG